jgi:hypothetical protein
LSTAIRPNTEPQNYIREIQHNFIVRGGSLVLPGHDGMIKEGRLQEITLLDASNSSLTYIAASFEISF